MDHMDDIAWILRSWKIKKKKKKKKCGDLLGIMEQRDSLTPFLPEHLLVIISCLFLSM